MAMGLHLEIKEEVKELRGWPTDTFSIDVVADNELTIPHTLIVFIPGNPGCIGWYKSMLADIVQTLRSGFAARGVSYAGHGTTSEIVDVKSLAESKPRDVEIPWTVDGQIQHKIDFLTWIISDWHAKVKADGKTREAIPTKPRLILIGHSIGCHMIQRVLIARGDFLDQTSLSLYLMPFTRMDAPRNQQKSLDFGAARPTLLIGAARRILHIFSMLPDGAINSLMKSTVEDEEGRNLAINLLKQATTYPRNFFELGTEEIRDVPQEIDVCALRTIGEQSSVAILYCNGDHWAPTFHRDELLAFQNKKVIPESITVDLISNLQHDFVSRNDMISQVSSWCVQMITNNHSLAKSVTGGYRIGSVLSVRNVGEFIMVSRRNDKSFISSCVRTFGYQRTNSRRKFAIQKFNSKMMRKSKSKPSDGKPMTAEDAGVPNETAAYMESLKDTEVIERVRCVIKEAHVFKLPTRQTAGGWRGAEWTDEVWQGTVKVVERGDLTLVLLVDKTDGSLFAVCPIKDGAVDRCVDSTRYFVLRIENANGRHMFVGMAFNERNDSFDFNTSLEDARREREAALNPEPVADQGPAKDYSIKEGEKIRVNLKNIGGHGGDAEKRKSKTGGKKKAGGFTLKASSRDTPRRASES